MSSRGFTLIEVMISLCLASLVMVTMFTAFRSQRQSYQAQEDVVDLQQSVRAGLSLLADDLRMAGYDPDGTDNYGFTSASSNQFTVTMVSDWDGMNNDPGADTITDEIGEENQITYSLVANVADPVNFNDLVRVADGSLDQLQIIENIRGNRLQFLYTLADGSGPLSVVPAEQLKDIRKVDVYIIAESFKRIGQSNYMQSYDVPDGVGGTTTWNVTGRHLFVQKTIFCRNMNF